MVTNETVLADKAMAYVKQPDRGSGTLARQKREKNGGRDAHAHRADLLHAIIIATINKIAIITNIPMARSM